MLKMFYEPASERISASLIFQQTHKKTNDFFHFKFMWFFDVFFLGCWRILKLKIACSAICC